LLAQQQRKRGQAGLTAYRKPGLYAGNRHPWTLPTIASLPLPLVASNLPQLQKSIVMMMMMPAILLPSPHLVMVPCTLPSLLDPLHHNTVKMKRHCKWRALSHESQTVWIKQCPNNSYVNQPYSLISSIKPYSFFTHSELQFT
jgi:hypothetical protein